ncbi:site-specific integrase [Zhihengliuella sp. ISTPL4]|uniref:integrase n=1 Tax=Zhihengliuella sp. ISTPL4 TaxID=2058657 RepID=UPI0013052F09|nr:integrase [Zhihengliuella sp. ISTPL4]
MINFELMNSDPPSVLPSRTDPIYDKDKAPSKRDKIPEFGAAVWPIRFFSDNPSSHDLRIKWNGFPAEYREHFRLATWALFNLPMPAEILAQLGTRVVSRLSAGRIYHSAVDWRTLAKWMRANGIEHVRDLDEVALTSYATYLRETRRLDRGTMGNHFMAINRLWIIGLQIPALELREAPPWLTGSSDDLLPESRGEAGENITDPISTPTISALLDAALAFVNMAGPIVDAVVLQEDIKKHASLLPERGEYGANKRLAQYVAELRESGSPIPLKEHRGRRIIDAPYLALQSGLSVGVVQNWALTKSARELARAAGEVVHVDLGDGKLAPLKVPLSRVVTYRRLLETACFITIAYLTGMRPGEVLALESGVLHPSQRGGWMLIRSRAFKPVRDDDGNHDSRGRTRAAPWVAITPVVQAIRILERLSPLSGLLFPSKHHVKNAGRSTSPNTISRGIQFFIKYVNASGNRRIPDDPLGPVNPLRLRRTLAWHIANQPGGLVALAVQYGHLRTAISEGYASRVRNGIHDLIDFETARSIALRLSEMSEAADAGEEISGPAAFRLATALRERNAGFPGLVTSQRQASLLLSNPDLTIFDSDDALFVCAFDRDTARCLSDTEEAFAPRIDLCHPNCTNIARMDRHATRLRLSATRLRGDAEVLPAPAAERLRIRASELDQVAQMHDEQRRAIGEYDDSAG